MRKLILFVSLVYSIYSLGQNINIPDPILKNRLVTLNFNNNTAFDQNGDSIKIDLDNDNEVSVTEAARVYELHFNQLSFQSGIGLNDFPNLETLYIQASHMTVFTLDGLSNLKDLRVEGHRGNVFGTVWLTSLTLNNLITLSEVRLDSNDNLSTLNMSNLPALEIFQVRFSALTSLDFTGMQNLERITADNNNLTNVNLTGLPSLEYLTLSRNQLTSIDITTLPILRSLGVNVNSLTSLDISNNPLIHTIYAMENQLNSLTFNGQYTILNNLDLGQNQFTSIDVLQFPNLERLDLDDNMLSSIDISSSDNLDFLRVGNNNLNNIDVTDRVNLRNLYINENNLINFDIGQMGVNHSSRLINLSDNILLESINVKNNLSDVFFQNNINNLPNLLYVCVDDQELSNFSNSFPNTVVNSYCSFTPGGNFNEIKGSISIDVDNNGCDTTDPVFPNFNFTATDGTITGVISSNQAGEYYAPVQDGQHTITPNPENPTYWNFSPANVVVDFPTQTSPFTQDFCVTANGTVEDLEVVVVPLEQARPGFDTDYKVVIKNKGNVTTSGSVTLDFEEGFITLLSSTPTAAMPITNQLSWSVSNLQPFQMEEYEFTMTLNTPTQATNPLNGGDILTFTGTVTGTGADAMPADNVMVFDQTVVNSYDPNDKTCLEGKTIDPSDVGEYVHYMIRFENTGTASAVNIVVKDEIDLSQFDITTLIPLGGSHDYYTRIREGNVVEFIHEDINLDFNDATNDGHVLFKIKTLNTLVTGDTFDNTAEIYFDFNFPIVTNTETVTVQSTASIYEATDASIAVYPNPTSSLLNITSENGIQNVTVMNINGRLLSQYQFTSNQLAQQIDVSNLGTGMYFVTIVSDLGSSTQKVVVE
ncbi:putative repeat protein (TIGR01451 family)/predicted secreted protein (Por secretion system target) [Nonlabens dokdonensis]|uniref:Repeat protein (TIGR01451 family)/predicted secreted protein (Por secretion system target) n=2 Tax=Nonlabens dokdonensis TaxID=328515 RepID=A0ABX5PWY6_9FLAO|nr:T9SS type A sorting domain-containing protein [Nonlabens dokdonensis]AGC77768.1 putative membrane-anchored cell surface protein [Nonlabens dokdonensis DSW-6]PZX39699.1 putative repeat protein (TIGR01451 family)/predicted secreted protein (Por secretion system target) [Nonlabens dokdonensis]